MQIVFGGETLVLRPDKTLFWPSEKTLFASDLHFGKLAHFRKNGSGIPDSGSKGLIQMIDFALKETGAERLVILGDFFHSLENKALIEIAEHWNFHLESWLIPGNHDIINPKIYEYLGFKVHSDPHVMKSLILTHIPPDGPSPGKFYLSGHLHPAIRIAGKARQSMRVPCFFQNEQQLILPAMGVFTGTYTIQLENNTDRAYAIAGNSIFELKL